MSVRSRPCDRAFWLLLASAGCGSGEAPAAPGGPPVYAALSETGLYAEPSTLALAGNVRELTPAFALWSDGADKRRWLELPRGTSIDTTDMNRWLFPIGTRLWKEFSLGGVRLETRLIERYGPEADDYWMGAFVWSMDQSDAWLAEQGQDNVLGTAHDAPAQDRCTACHNGEPGRVLGVSALQLGAALVGSSGGDLASLGAEGLLSTALPAPLPAPPGGAVAAAAFGYLHANCGHCHNPRGSAWPDTQMLLRFGIEDTQAESSGVFQSIVGQRMQYFRDTGGLITLRVDPGHPESSGLIARMSTRGPREQMPPLATETIDPTGIDLVTRWIETLPKIPE